MKQTLFENTIESIPSGDAFISQFTLKPIKPGVLNGLTFAVKDVIDIKGQKTGCGNPTWFNEQMVSEVKAICVEQLLAEGATCTGKTVLGEFCSGSTGVNHYYGMPINPKAPDRVPGGSSSGSAVAVAAGQVDFSLGTDVAGSVRLPASFCGVWGMRPSYGAISMAGVKSFAPDFDTIGIFARTPEVLDNVFTVLSGKSTAIKQNTTQVKKFYVIEDYLGFLDLELQQLTKEYIVKYCDSLGLSPTYIQLTDIHPDAKDREIT